MTGSDEVAHDREMSQARFELTSATLASEPDVWVQNVLIARPQLQPGVYCKCNEVLLSLIGQGCACQKHGTYCCTGNVGEADLVK